MFRDLTRTVWILSVVSLLADLASEMLYPVMPAFLDEVGLTAAGIGLLEGIASLIAGFGKAWFGSWSDRIGRRNVFVRVGYGLSAVAKPLMALFPYVVPVFLARMADRVGKGMRGGARDALLSAECSPENRGRVFGFHRSMDTIGAVGGAALALAWLHYRPGELSALFLIAAGPGLLSVAAAFLLPREEYHEQKEPKRPFKGIFGFYLEASGGYKRLLVGGLLFALVNSSDLLLLLKAGESGLSPEAVVGLYLLYNIVYVLASFPFGNLADKVGFKPVYIASILVYGICYLGMGLATESWHYWVLFGLYGCFTAANEGIMSAWLTTHLPKDRKATGMGLYSFGENLSKFIASPLLGIVWLAWNGPEAFASVGVVAILLSVAFVGLLPRSRAE